MALRPPPPPPPRRHVVLRYPQWALPTDVWGQRFLPRGPDDSAAALFFLRFPVVEKIRGESAEGLRGCIGLEEYRAVGKRGVGGAGILHAKAVHTDSGTLLGSTNWTTSSRANIELGAELALGDLEAAELKDWMSSVIEGGETINDAEVLVMQRSRSESPSRKR